MKLKVGDKVKLRNKDYYSVLGIKYGNTGTIVEVEKDTAGKNKYYSYRISFPSVTSRCFWFDSTEVKRAKPETKDVLAKDLKIMDKIGLAKSDANGTHGVGEIWSMVYTPIGEMVRISGPVLPGRKEEFSAFVYLTDTVVVYK